MIASLVVCAAPNMYLVRVNVQHMSLYCTVKIEPGAVNQAMLPATTQ